MNKKGVILIFSLLVITVLTALGSAILSRSISEKVNTDNFLKSARAFWLAEAGIQRAMWEINYNNCTGFTLCGNSTACASCSSCGQKCMEMGFGSYGDFNITVNSANSEVTAGGFYPDKDSSEVISRNLQVTITAPPQFNFALFGRSTLDISSDVRVDSYDSALGEYNVDGNKGTEGNIGVGALIDDSGDPDYPQEGEISLAKKSYVDGDATIGTDGSIDRPENVVGAKTYNTDTTLADVTVPSSLTNLTSSGSINYSGTEEVELASGDYKYDSISLSGQAAVTVTGPANIYLTGDSGFGGQGGLIISSESTGPVVIYTDGGVNISGQGIVNETNLPTNLYIYGTSSCDEIDFSGQASLYGGIYAPDAEIGLSGQGSLYGAALGKEISMSGQGTLHYDQALSRQSSSASRSTIDNWEEL